ncbi:hypothetical protein [Aureibaculum luteum]|uniref:hypothetical protein n=1 Tax=Aureibaculum luteum TaxID=1548456 RepID=UPI0013003B90|nr:hypothetical protein [Aureibaculum luteum]
MSKAMFLKVGSVVWSTIIMPIVPSGKAYRSINPKYFMLLIFLSFLIPLGIFFFNIDTALANDVTMILTMDVLITNSIFAVIQSYTIFNISINSGWFS